MKNLILPLGFEGYVFATGESREGTEVIKKKGRVALREIEILQILAKPAQRLVLCHFDNLYRATARGKLVFGVSLFYLLRRNDSLRLLVLCYDKKEYTCPT